MRGSIIKRGNTYTYVLDLGFDAAGKRRQKWIGGFRTKKEAEDALGVALGRVQAGTFADAGRTTVREFLEVWIAGAAPSLAPSTAADYRRIITQYLVPRLGRVKLSKLTSLDVTQFNADMLAGGGKGGRKLSPRTVVYAQSVLGRALADAVRWGLIARNPAHGLARPKVAKPDMSVWTAEQARTFLAYAAEDRWYALWLLLITTGLRRGEASGLRWSDLDLDAKVLSVRRTRTTVDYAIVENEPKTARSRRMVSLDAATVAALLAHRVRQREELVAFDGEDAAPAVYVFTDELGEPSHPQAITDRFQRLTKDAGLPVIRLHDLRHTSATLALMAGIHPKVVQERLGHSSIMITMDTYSHVVQGMQEQAAEQLASLLRPQGEAS